LLARLAAVVLLLANMGCSEPDSSTSATSTAAVAESLAQDGTSASAAATSLVRNDEARATHATRCDWVDAVTVADAVPEPFEPESRDDVDDGVRACGWRNREAELTIRFADFLHPIFRSVEWELLRIGGDPGEDLVVVGGIRGAFPRPGVWYGETPLQQHGMAKVHLVNLDGSEHDQAEFEALVAAIIEDVRAADPAVP
jgi:hypothetical protein